MPSPWHPSHGPRREADPDAAWYAACAIILLASLLLTGWLAVQLLIGG